MLGGDSESKINNTCIDEDCNQSSSCVASVGKSKAIGGKSKAVGDNDSNDNNDDDNDDDVCTLWRSCVAGNPPSLGKVRQDHPAATKSKGFLLFKTKKDMK